MNTLQVSNNLKKVVRFTFALTTSTIIGGIVANARSEANISIVDRFDTAGIRSAENSNLPLFSPSWQVTSEDFLPSEDVYAELLLVDKDATEEGFPIPSTMAKKVAEFLLSYIVGFAGPVSVYPTIDGEIAIDAYSERGSVIVLCEPSGSVYCMSNVDGIQESKRFELLETLVVDRFISDNLELLYAS